MDTILIDRLAQEIRRVDGSNSLGAAALAEALMPFVAAMQAAPEGVEWVAAGGDYDRNIHCNPDAKAWADFFVATYPGLATHHGTMIGWFANAMMAMHDHLKNSAAPSPTAALQAGEVK